MTLHSFCSQLRHRFMQSLRGRLAVLACDVLGCDASSSTSLSSSEISARLFVVAVLVAGVLEYCCFFIFAIASKNSLTDILFSSSRSDAFLIIVLLSYDLERFFLIRHRAYKLRNFMVRASSNRSRKCKKLKKFE